MQFDQVALVTPVTTSPAPGTSDSGTSTGSVYVFVTVIVNSVPPFAPATMGVAPVRCFTIVTWYGMALAGAENATPEATRATADRPVSRRDLNMISLPIGIQAGRAASRPKSLRDPPADHSE